MRIQLSARTRAFTVLGNDVLRDRRLSFTARGILAYLLSLPDGAREDVRTLADRNPGLGRRGIAKALDELVALGYYVRRTVRDEESGQVRTQTFVFDTPQSDFRPDSLPGSASAPLPVVAGSGERRGGSAGTSPRVENPVEEPSLPGAPESPPGCPAPAADSRGAALLAGLGVVDARLALSSDDLRLLAPAAEEWLERGVSVAEARALLTSGLPRVVHSARAFVADRLKRKIPPERPRTPAAAALAECARCRDPLPRGQRAGICGGCSGVRAVHGGAPPLEPATIAQRAGAIRDALRGVGLQV